MTVAARKPMSRVEFLDWVEGQEGRFEFDGAAPVAMTGGTVLHHRLQRRLMRVLGERLDGGPCEPFGPEAAIATVGDAVRFPDAVVSCSPLAPAARVIDRPVVVFEILSPGSARVDRIVKLREYGAVASIAIRARGWMDHARAGGRRRAGAAGPRCVAAGVGVVSGRRLRARRIELYEQSRGRGPGA